MKHNECVCASLVPIFNHLSHDDLIKISSITIHKKYTKQETIAFPQQTGKLLIIAKGKAKVYQLSDSGKEQLLRVLEIGDFVGEEALFGVLNEHTFVEALSDVEVCMIQQHDFMKLLETYPTISFALLKEYNRRLKETQYLATRISLESVSVRLAHYLLDVAKAQGTNIITLPLSMKELAHFLGTTPETISRRMKDFEKRQLIKRAGKEVHILNKEELL